MSINMNINRKKGVLKKTVIPLLLISLLIIVVLLNFLRYHNTIFGPNVDTGGSKTVEIYIPTNPTFEEVIEILKFSGYIVDIEGFIWVANRKNYQLNLKSGRYVLKDNMSNNDLVNMLRAGLQTPVNVTFNNIRTLEQLAGIVAKRLEPDSLQFVQIFQDEEVCKKLGFNKESFLSMFIPNTYQIWWNTSPEDFLKRMKKEYERFWNANRLEKAEKAGLTPIEVSILASIVDEETKKYDEKPRVAGLYINRLRKGMKLQADPTVIFAMGNFSIQRVLFSDLKINSPYNTYIHEGLPPGPIRIPSIQAIDAVLNFEKHNYLYMCAKEDFSGYHSFANTLEQHNRNATKYHQALKKAKISR